MLDRVRARLRLAIVRLAFGADPAELVRELRAVLRFAREDRWVQRLEVQIASQETQKLREDLRHLRDLVDRLRNRIRHLEAPPG